MEILRRTVEMVRVSGLRVSNVDLTILCERPRIGPHADAIRGSLAAALEVAHDQVSVKGKSNEGMGWEGRGEGLAVHAVALLRTG
jgi:2-C-methyl-D-erythritol 2,4-cyclodiphosphate synthase